MKAAVRYFSKTGNTKKIADAIANTAACEAKTVSEPLAEYTDILFLGAAVYYGGISSEVKSYIHSLDRNTVGQVVVFSTSAMTDKALPQICAELSQRGISVAEDHFYCRGKFKMLHRDRPDANDVQRAKRFAESFLQPHGCGKMAQATFAAAN